VSGDLTLGFIPLNDCAPLAVAEAKGFFRGEGLAVTLSREASWATVRDKVAVGALDGGHMLGPMVLAASQGVGGERTAMTAPLSLNLSGSAFTVSTALAAALRRIDPEGFAARTARPLARLVAERRKDNQPPLTFAVVFPYSMHNYQLRYWLAEAGVDPDRDVRLVVTPPPRTAEQLRSGLIDGFCVGAPYGVQAAALGFGEILVYASEIWGAGPDKVLGVAERWATANPETLQALLRALIRAAQWADARENREELAGLLARPEYVGLPKEVVEPLLPNGPESVVYHRGAAGFPWRSHAAWFLSQMLRWGQMGPEVDLAAAVREVYRPDLYRTAAAALGLPAPAEDAKIEGAHAEAWVLATGGAEIAMAPDRFCDGRLFDPAQPLLDYAAGFAITRAQG
jgi:ABC-type nitrate/sulfonate/bicarbonate transport system substrate-binding protein